MDAYSTRKTEIITFTNYNVHNIVHILVRLVEGLLQRPDYCQSCSDNKGEKNILLPEQKPMRP